jgi:hypothetical protein
MLDLKSRFVMSLLRNLLPSCVISR